MKEPTKETEEVPQGGGREQMGGPEVAEHIYIFFFLEEGASIMRQRYDLIKMNIVFLEEPRHKNSHHLIKQ